MDRRTKFILLVIGSVLLLAAVLWFVVWPLLSPTFLKESKPQPPAVGQPNAPSLNGGTEPSGTGNTQPSEVVLNPSDVHPDVLRIIELSRRAGVLAERVESGSSENGFENLITASLDVSPSLAQEFRAKQEALRSAYPSDGAPYLTVATRLVEIPERNDRIEGVQFNVRVQLQVQVKDAGKTSVEYREATVTFELQGSDYAAVGYRTAPFSP